MFEKYDALSNVGTEFASMLIIRSVYKIRNRKILWRGQLGSVQAGMRI